MGYSLSPPIRNRLTRSENCSTNVLGSSARACAFFPLPCFLPLLSNLSKLEKMASRDAISELQLLEVKKLQDNASQKDIKFPITSKLKKTYES